MKDKKLSEGVHIPEIFNFIGWGGIFLQVGFDDYLPMDEIPNNTVIKGMCSIPRPPIPPPLQSSLLFNVSSHLTSYLPSHIYPHSWHPFHSLILYPHTRLSQG